MDHQFSDDKDVDAWYRYPQYRQWFNKLYVADLFGYCCGPAGIPVPECGNYVVRPIYNLAGMGVGAKLVYITPDDLSLIPPGHFWVECFQGTHYSVDYVRDEHGFSQSNCYTGVNDPDDLSRFYHWKRSDYQFCLPKEIANIDVPKINIEAIGDKVIEIHLRDGFDHLRHCDEMIPVFAKDPLKSLPGYKFVENAADGYGWLDNPRLGYWVR